MYLPTTRELRERIDAATALTRLFYRERAATVTCGGWARFTAPLELKAALATTAWQCALAADAMRERVFELRYPVRFLEAQSEEISVDTPDALRDLLAQLRGDYDAYLAAADPIADGPSARIVETALRDKQTQIDTLASLGPLDRRDPARDDRYFLSSFYWPDAIDPSYPYGEGVALQLRSAVSHLNEVWAVEAAGAILHAFADELGWEFVRDAARWLYDESRHMLMGKERLERWGFEPARIPLGGYIYEACRDEDPIYLLGMLGYFETKNIGRKRDRAAAFREMGDRTSESDMEFDWADETIHAEYGRRWLKRLLEVRGQDPETWPGVLERCEQLVEARVQAATGEERERIRGCADALVAEAEQRARETR
jgi:uncharacterized ferritin-like protein (DUF455 family)